MRTLSRNLVAAAIVISAAVLWTGNVFAASKAEHVVVVVMDGLRPDFVTEKYMPTLHKLASEGVLFKNHHPVYVSSTEANGAALATGCYQAVPNMRFHHVQWCGAGGLNIRPNGWQCQMRLSGDGLVFD